MPRFRYKAIDEKGAVIEKEGKFSSVLELMDHLKKEKLTLISVKELEEKEEKKFSIYSLIPVLGKVSDKEFAILCRQLSVLISAGVGLVEALEIIADQVSNRRLKEALLEVARRVEEGTSLYNAMKARSDVFPELIINLVAVGEETGELDIVLKKASEYYEKMAFIKGKIKSASMYPTFVGIVAFLIVWGILVFVVPKFQDIYRSLGGELPWPTQVLINVSNALRENIAFGFALLLIFTVVFYALYKNVYSFRESVHNFLLRIPKIGNILEKAALARFARTLATLYSAGVPIERALEIAAKVVGLIPIEKAVERAKKDVLEGKTLWSALQSTGKFPKMVIAMVKVGEETGRIDEMLTTIAAFYEEEVDRMIEGLISLIEPLLIVFLGTVIGLILIALYLPIFKIGELIV